MPEAFEDDSMSNVGESEKMSDAKFSSPITAKLSALQQVQVIYHGDSMVISFRHLNGRLGTLLGIIEPTIIS